jgi:alpha-N-arabinofuranosidase
VEGLGQKKATVYTLTGPDVNARNTMENPNVVDIASETITVDTEFEHTFKPFSCSVIEVELE